jgi:hypothetical protein
MLVNQDIHLVGRHRRRTSLQTAAILPDFSHENLQVFDGIPAGSLGDVNEVDEETCTEKVAKEAMPQPMTLVRPSYQARNVGQYVLPVFAADHSQMRGKGCERITGDLGAGGAHSPE